MSLSRNLAIVNVIIPPGRTFWFLNSCRNKGHVLAWRHVSYGTCVSCDGSGWPPPRQIGRSMSKLLETLDRGIEATVFRKMANKSTFPLYILGKLNNGPQKMAFKGPMLGMVKGVIT